MIGDDGLPPIRDPTAMHPLVPRLLALSLALPALHPARAAAQTHGDSVAVLVASVEAFLGTPPFEHPEGGTDRLCLGPLDSASPRIPGAEPAGAGLVSGAAGALVEGGVTVSEHCFFVSSSSRPWIVDGGGEPAIQLRLGRPRFPSRSEAEIPISATRAVVWGRGAVCHVVRPDPESPWEPRDCRTVWLS